MADLIDTAAALILAAALAVYVGVRLWLWWIRDDL